MTPAEIEAAVQAFLELEPEIQKGVAALIHLIHHKSKPATPAQTPAPAAPAAQGS